MSHWCVEVVGDRADLNMLTGSMSTGSTSITMEADKFILRCDAFDGLDAARSVAQKAKQILSALSGATRLALGGHTSMAVGGVYRVRDDGGRDTFIITETGNLQIRGFPATVVVTRSDGTEEIHRPADRIPPWLALATTDDAVAKALRLRDDESLGWVELYRIYEVIESDVGGSAMVANGWASKRDIRRFKHTANSVAAAGDQARHGRETGTRPAKPLTLSEARALVDALLQAWLANKGS
jgi:hypothetical protein